MRSLISPVSAEVPDLGATDREKIRQALVDLIESRPFRSTQQCSSLLRYIVEHTLSGEEALLRERVIGAEVFGRPPGYETNEDPVVRLRVAEVRKRLAQYYSAQSAVVDVKIEIPPGSYRASFQFRSVEAPLQKVEPPASFEPGLAAVFPSAPSSEPDQDHSHAKTKTRLQRNTWIAIAVALVLFTLLGARIVRDNTADQRCFRAFWAPWIASNRPVVLSVGSNAVYRLKPDYILRYAQQHGLEAQGQEIYIPLGKENPVSGSDLVPSYNSFVAWGDVEAATTLSASLAKQGHPFQDRFPNDVSYAELRSTPSVLIGGFNNPMTIELTKNLEFVLLRGNEILDSEHPSRKWTLQAAPDTADYAILTRLVQRDGDAPLLAVAGIGQFGTIAAAHLVCDPAAIYRISRELPKDWATKNLQAVLHVSVVDFKPTITGVLAYKSW